MKHVLVAACICALAGCSSVSLTNADEQTSGLISSSYQAVDRLVADQALFTPDRKILVATVVSLNKLNESSAFGRLLAEHASSRLVQRGANVTELKLRGNLFVSEKQGELMLSREVREVSTSLDAEAVLVGTYVDAADRVFVTLKLIRARDAKIVSAYNYSIEKSQSVYRLLND